MRTLVIQSFRTKRIPAWVKSCLDSVNAWCEHRGYHRRFIGDEIFERVPGWYLEKTGTGPVATDYGRLILLQEALERDGYDQAVWLDADVIVMDQSMMLDCDNSCAFGQEIWVQDEEGGLKVRKNVHNAVCLFRQGSVVLPFLIETVASIISRADPDRIAPQMVGPKLLTALNSLCNFDLLPQVGAVSPAVARDLQAGSGPALELFLQKSPVALQAVNLCASLLEDETAERVISGLSRLATAD